MCLKMCLKNKIAVFLNLYRTDGTDSMKIYSDPSFFFNVWSNDIIATNANRKAEKNRNKVLKKNNFKNI